MNDKSMAISKRDRQLLSILIAFVVLFLLYFFIASPALDQATVLVDQRLASETNLQTMTELIAQGPKLKGEVETKKSELTEKYMVFLYSISEPNILNQMDGLMTVNGFAIESYSQSEHIVSKLVLPASAYTPAMYPLRELAKKLNPLAVEEVMLNEGEPSSEGSVDSVEQIDIGIGFTGVAYDALYRFLQALEELDRSYIVSDIQIVNDPQVPGLDGLLVIRAVSLPKIDPEEAADLTFTPTLPQGRTSPF